jgi:hypothetical protein
LDRANTAIPKLSILEVLSVKSDMNGVEFIQLFDPWRGRNYETGYGGVRTLVLGESTYLGRKTRQQFEHEYRLCGRTWFNDLVQEYQAGEWTHQYWTKWIKAFQGQLPNFRDRLEILDKVAFYNFGDVMVDGSRMPPSSSAYYQTEEARKKFERICEAFGPRLIVVLAYRLWDDLPLHGRKGPRMGRFDTWHYTFGSTDSLALSLPHPSTSAWRSAETHAAIKSALDFVRHSATLRASLGGNLI